MRPLGIPVVEDKLLQLAVTRILEAIYEHDFLRCICGYRLNKGALDVGSRSEAPRQQTTHRLPIPRTDSSEVRRKLASRPIPEEINPMYE